MANRRRPRPAVDDQPQEIKPITPLNKEQGQAIKLIHNNDIVFISGAAGSGKSFLCAALAAEYLQRRLVNKIIVCRSSVQADEIGFLKGTADEKMQPLLTPILIELSEFINVKKEIAEGRLEILSLAFTRGRTFKNSFAILEEAQNCTYEQLKLFITRIGENSKVIINGDVSQSDLHREQLKDFPNFMEELKSIAYPENRIAIIKLLKSVRHPIIDLILGTLKR